MFIGGVSAKTLKLSFRANKQEADPVRTKVKDEARSYAVTGKHWRGKIQVLISTVAEN